MNPIQKDEMNETARLTSAAASRPYVPVTDVGRTFGTTYFLVSTLLASIVPIIQLGIGLNYKGLCPINQHISTYMIVAGICGLALVGLSLLISLTFICFIPDSTTLTVLASCHVCFNVLAVFIISIFLFIWFILGCIWVFSVRNKVQFQDLLKPNYCQPVLYKAAFIFLIVTIVLACIQCCISCVRQCRSTDNMK
ncbi:unnamed protein product [Rotaria magnacalcarata]|uniref:Uncharacterized protein n=1 Tax=Rotaria magnacalcarata TaxID=392030 RepID=A0A814ECY7_9BILA|nr:unnamed protein product [Rotaria magnacalcarata]CAF1599399.1 unnamed protein product [Rotaria magnacalcarata]